MPVVRPTEFMFQNHSHLGKEKWELYDEFVRKIYCEVEGFKECNLCYRYSNVYTEAMIKRKFDNETFLNKKRNK